MFSENIHFGNRFVLAVEDKEVNDEQQQRNQRKALELLIVIRKYLCLDLLGRQFVEFLLDGFGGSVRVVATDVDTTAGLGDLTTHVLVQTTHDHIPLTVLAEGIRTRHRNRCTLRFTDTYYQHLNSRLFCTFGNCHGIVLVVLSIGDEDDGSASITLFSKATNRRTQGLTDRRSLRLNQLRFDAVKEHLRGHVVTGDRQLHERVSGEDHQTHFVVDHVVHQFGQHLFGAVQTIRCDILCQH